LEYRKTTIIAHRTGLLGENSTRTRGGVSYGYREADWSFPLVRWPHSRRLADDDQLRRIGKVPKREFMRRGINQHPLEKICKREPVRASKLTQVLRVLQQWESEH